MPEGDKDWRTSRLYVRMTSRSTKSTTGAFPGKFVCGFIECVVLLCYRSCACLCARLSVPVFVCQCDRAFAHSSRVTTKL